MRNSEKFWKLSSPLNSLCELTAELTFEKFCQEDVGKAIQEWSEKGVPGVEVKKPKWEVERERERTGEREREREKKRERERKRGVEVKKPTWEVERERGRESEREREKERERERERRLDSKGPSGR